jgi:hypothetical protein
MTGFMNTTEKLEANKPVIAGIRITWLKKTFYFDVTKIKNPFPLKRK